MTITHTNARSESAHCLVVFSLAGEPDARTLFTTDAKTEAAYAPYKGEPALLHEAGETLSLHLGTKQTLIIVGIEANTPPFTGESLRAAASVAYKAAGSVPEVVVDLSALSALSGAVGIGEADVISALTEGFTLASYRFDTYLLEATRKERGAGIVRPARVTFLSDRHDCAAIISRAKMLCEGTRIARDLVNEPGNALGADALAKRAKRLASEAGVKARILSREKLAAMGMGGILAVNKGSATPARLIMLEYHPKKKKQAKRFLVVGKGVTFDSGGISLKPSEKMGDMKCDMAGGAVAIATVITAARLQLPFSVIGVVPATDNMPDATAQRPGDIITMYNGTTVEVDNTDAEGRLILADALAYAIKKYTPTLTVDLATLTGACVIALGEWTAALMTNRAALAPYFTKAGEETYERVCRLPLYDEYKKQLSSKVADLKNVGGRPAGAITAGKFLEHFVDKTAWAHFDIAGTAFIDDESVYRSAGATGFGVRLLLRAFEEIAAKGDVSF